MLQVYYFEVKKFSINMRREQGKKRAGRKIRNFLSNSNYRIKRKKKKKIHYIGFHRCKHLISKSTRDRLSFSSEKITCSENDACNLHIRNVQSLKLTHVVFLQITRTELNENEETSCTLITTSVDPV